jgi:excisionase family DNA binding protein
MKPATELPRVPSVAPRLLRIADAAHYLSCTYGLMETLIREKRIRSMILGKRRVVDLRDLDEFVDRIKEQVSE